MVAKSQAARYDPSPMPTTNTEDFVKPNPRIPSALVEELRIIAKAERRSLNDQIVIAIEEHVKRWKEAQQ